MRAGVGSCCCCCCCSCTRDSEAKRASIRGAEPTDDERATVAAAEEHGRGTSISWVVGTAYRSPGDEQVAGQLLCSAWDEWIRQTKPKLSDGGARETVSLSGCWLRIRLRLRQSNSSAARILLPVGAFDVNKLDVCFRTELQRPGKSDSDLSRTWGERSKRRARLATKEV